MRLQGREVTPTRASQLALRDEQQLIQEGYEFLDEKRMLLAQELLRQLQAYKALNEPRQLAHKQALAQLVAASMRHGLEELSLYPPPFAADLVIERDQRKFIGFSLIEANCTLASSDLRQGPPQPVYPSQEATDCAKAFRDLISTDVARAAINTNIHRLIDEYINTERRARALENVVLPEIAEVVKHIGESLETSDQEEALQVRHAKMRQTK